ncbi:MAG: hypothetical protein LBS82_05225 [Spirochaetaceae bacterium]|jgi:hypothetical protein|nr:hypothetical protein [Spirochaetaceae bacterium]
MDEERKRQVNENVGKVFLDMAKLTFASFILGGILRGSVPQYVIIVTGGALTIGLLTLGLWFISKT